MKCVSVLGPTAKTWPQKFALTGCVYIFNCLILIQQLMSWPSEHDQKRTTNKKGANDCKYEAAGKKKNSDKNTSMRGKQVPESYTCTWAL